MRTLTLLLCAIAFGLAYGQAPLYYSNQNQYFLHGMANAEVGLLDEDWLGNTADPTPIFSLLVEATMRYLHPYAFHLYYLILQAIFLASLVGIFTHLARDRGSLPLTLVFIFLIVAVHSALGRWASNRLVGLDVPWYLQAGLAGQYILGSMFQPSTFGVLLVLAVSLFLHGYRYWAAALVSLTATLHFTYLLPAGMLTLGFMYVVWRESDWKRAILLGAWALILVLPIVIFVLIRFRPTSAEAFAEAQHILVHFRIPHHSLPRLWLDPVAMAQIAWMIAGAALAYRTRLFPVLVIPMILAALLTILQVTTESDTLSLLFPWRVSSVLMPLTTAVILGRLVLLARPWLDTALAKWASVAGIAALALAGLVLLALGQGFQSTDEEVPMMNFVKEHKKPGDVYLLPLTLPNLKATTRGSRSGDFRPVVVRRKDRHIIPMNLQRFRLHTQAPIFVDFKAIPYRDVDVLEWRRRLDQNVELQERFVSGNGEEVREDLANLGITHVIVPAHQQAAITGVRQVYADEAYRVYRLE